MQATWYTMSIVVNDKIQCKEYHDTYIVPEKMYDNTLEDIPLLLIMISILVTIQFESKESRLHVDIASLGVAVQQR